MNHNKDRASRKFLKNKQNMLTQIIAQAELVANSQRPSLNPQKYTEQTAIPTAALQHPDSLTKLLQAAKLTVANSQQRKKVKADPNNIAFLTGVDLSPVQVLPQQKQQIKQPEVLQEEVINLLKKRTLEDELQELRREIRQTGISLGTYSRQILQSKEEIVKLGWRYGSPFKMDSLQFGSDRQGGPHLKSYLEGKRSKRHLHGQKL